jgi:hypothetical protein
MEMDMATVEERKYEESEESEESEEIDESHTDRDTIIRNSTHEFVKNEEEEPEKKLVIVESQKCGLDRVRSKDGHTFRVVHDAAKKCVNIMFDQEMKEPTSCKVDRCTPKAMKKTRQESVEEERMYEFFMPKNVETSTLQPPDIKSFKVGAKHVKKAAKKARQKATKNGAEATMEDTWQLECTYGEHAPGITSH